MRNVFGKAAFLLALAACSQANEAKHSGASPSPQQPAPVDDPKDTKTPADPAKDPPKDPADPTNNADPKEGVTPVLAFFGGFTSCGAGENGDPNTMEIKAVFDATAKALKAQFKVDPAYIIVCYTTDYESVYYRLSTASTVVKSEVIAGMEHDLGTLLSTIAHPVLYLVGHSYGGWTAMDTVLNLDPEYKVGGLVTLDPISHADCSPTDFLNATFGAGGAAEGCIRAPEDFGAVGITKIGERSTTWLNYYQTQLSYLHSGEIKPAKNFLRHYDATGFGPHNGFLSDADVGAEIVTMITNSFKAQSGP